jgi:hypothetical protein
MFDHDRSGKDHDYGYCRCQSVLLFPGQIILRPTLHKKEHRINLQGLYYCPQR